MKVRTVIISVVVTAALVGGAGYGAYYAISGQKTPVEVVPVANVNTGYWGDGYETIYGTVTSQVAQTIQLNDEYTIDEIYVEEGDKVKEGDPLFAYDMTLQELELEMEQLTLQTKELTLTKLEKDLEKYKNGKVDATLEDDDDYYTTSADEEPVIEETTAEPESGEESERSSADGTKSDTADQTEDGASDAASEDAQEIQLEGMEVVTGDDDATSIANSVASYESLVAVIDSLFVTYGDSLNEDELEVIGTAIDDALAYYRKHLADEKTTTTKDASGEELVEVSYELKDEVKAALSEAQRSELEEYTAKLESYQQQYEEMMEGQTTYTVTFQLPDDVTETMKYRPGETVTKKAPTADRLVIFAGWQIEGAEAEDTGSETLTFVMPEGDVTAAACYKPDGEMIEKYVGSFQSMTSEILSSGLAVNADYFTKLNDTISYFRNWLAVSKTSSDAVSDSGNGSMESYVLKSAVREYLDEQDASNGTESTADALEESYETLCKKYVRALFDALDSSALDQSLLKQAQEAYANLGDGWQKDLEQQWSEENHSNSMKYTIEDALNSYTVIQMFQEYQKLDSSASEDEKLSLLKAIMTAYQGLTETQKALVVAAIPSFAETMEANGLWGTVSESETEEETEFYTDQTEPSYDFGDGYDDGYDSGDWGDDGYTASELKELIEEKEREIKDCKLDIRESEITVNQKQRVVDGKIVKSTMDGTVISIGNPDGESDEEYFAKVANEEGLYAKGSMSELDLEQIHVGDTISGMMTDTGVSFTAVVKEISQYPDTEGSSYSFSSGNSNASYYPFYALLDDTEDITEGDAEIQLSETVTTSADSIYLEKYFVRSGSDGRNYVYIEGEDGLLKKQYVTTGKTVYSWAIEIVSGLKSTDNIAFPYGTDVAEGAPTKEVDMLDY
jgi:multidrug efflux pump subunit AcrA (membrane-fusion protein)